uniref:Uncharacterized protein n=1 Tax=Physcomitrium patens TaxID=3218 RepID=A0A2K1J0W3_PHYPA|nr:hypothetical protein PHYPA_023067 [Physcomitrium patens]
MNVLEEIHRSHDSICFPAAVDVECEVWIESELDEDVECCGTGELGCGTMERTSVKESMHVKGGVGVHKLF